MTQCGQGTTADIAEQPARDARLLESEHASAIADVARVIAERRPRHMVFVDFVDPDAPRGLDKATSTL